MCTKPVSIANMAPMSTYVPKTFLERENAGVMIATTARSEKETSKCCLKVQLFSRHGHRRGRFFSFIYYILINKCPRVQMFFTTPPRDSFISWVRGCRGEPYTPKIKGGSRLKHVDSWTFPRNLMITLTKETSKCLADKKKRPRPFFLTAC